MPDSQDSHTDNTLPCGIKFVCEYCHIEGVPHYFREGARGRERDLPYAETWFAVESAGTERSNHWLEIIAPVSKRLSAEISNPTLLAQELRRTINNDPELKEHERAIKIVYVYK